MNQKASEAGWFYHAPAKKADRVEPVGAPPASQIPGLGEVSVLPPEVPKEMVFLDTDSKYIRLAKMGGRKDLLVIRPNSGTKREAKSYPRNDWFYLEDNAQQDKAEKEAHQEAWKFLLPEYMVHQSMGETKLPEEKLAAGGVGVPMRPAPFAIDQQPSGPRSQPTTRTSKPKKQITGANLPKITAGNKPVASIQEQDEPPYRKYHLLPAEQEEPTNMSKLLAYSYEREWHHKHKEWEEKQAKNQRSPQLAIKNSKPPAVGNKTPQDQNPNASPKKALTAGKQEEQKKESFKLSKFKKVPPHLDTHRSTKAGGAKGQ